MSKVSVNPEDSASQQAARSSTSTSSSKVRARRAALEAEAATLRDIQALESEELKLRQRRREVELKTRLNIAVAEEEVLSQRGETSAKRRPSTTVRHEDRNDSTFPYPLRDEGDRDDLRHLLDAISLPKPEIMKFSGDPIRYHEFITCFDNMILKSSLDCGGKLMRLYHLCEGVAKNVIQSCMVMEPNEGFVRARELLAERFGSAYKIGEAWLMRVSEGNRIHANDNHGLLKFADDLQTCMETLKALKLTEEIGSQRELVRIVDRLPFHLQNSWLKVVRVVRQRNRPPNICDLVKFVAEAAMEVNDPVFGRHSVESRDKKSTKSKSQGSFSTGGQEVRQKDKLKAKDCVLCHQKHTIFSCEKFKGMTPVERVQLAKEKKLCFNCLKPGHMLAKCYLNRTCTVKGCGRKHTRFLHVGKEMQDKPAETEMTPDVLEQQSFAESSSATGAGGMIMALPIVAVRVTAGAGVVDTFALIDPGSTSSFCTEDLKNKLQVSGKKQTLRLSTVEKANSTMKCELISLQVEGTTTGKRVDLPRVYVKKEINISPDHFAKREDISKYSHLKDLDIPYVDCVQVDLLIGQNAPQVLIPLQVKSGNQGEMFAVRTMLGWTLNGPIDTDSHQNHITSSFVDIEHSSLEDQLMKFWSIESPDALLSNQKGLSASELLESKRWRYGPSFILQPEEEWPQNPLTIEPIRDADPEVKKEAVLAKTFATDSSVVGATDRLLCYFSDWHKLKKAVARMLQFQKYLQCKLRQESCDCKKSLSVEDLVKAERAVLRYVQQQNYPEELKELQKDVRKERKRKEQVSRVKKSSSLSKLDPKIFDDGLIHVGGRLQHASLEEKTKHPIILPKMHHVVRLIIRHLHQMSGHSGREYVLSLLRSQYWVIRGRVAVRQVLRNCVVCKRTSATPSPQKMADLPSDRVQAEKPPFTNVGVDCFGPFMVKQGRSHVKRYGCIFTCLVVRAVHIEIVHSMETDSFINALQRFMARRGQPEVIRSDNGTNFVGADRELRDGIRSWNQQKIQDHLLQKGVDWKFNPPSASHMGGSWERRIRTVRKVLSALLKQQALTDEGLSTLMCLVEAVINGRPLTVVSDDSRDLEPLTPNHLLLLKQNNFFPSDVFGKSDLYSRRRWRQIQYLADVFWRRWTREYLPALQQRKKWSTPVNNLAVGDIVLIKEDLPRNQWMLGRIIETYAGRDNLVRTCKVKTKSTTLVRPVHKLCLI